MNTIVVKGQQFYIKIWHRGWNSNSVGRVLVLHAANPMIPPAWWGIPYMWDPLYGLVSPPGVIPECRELLSIRKCGAK